MVGIITYDDAIDVVHEEAAEDAQLAGAVAPLSEGYLETQIFTLAWKRGIWLAILFAGALGTIFTLEQFEEIMTKIPWLVFFIPLVISTGGNSGSQSATLIITALHGGDVRLADWWRILRRELAMGMLLGCCLGAFGYLAALTTAPDYKAALVLPTTIVLVVMCGTLSGGLLPLLFRRLGLDPAMMSNPFVACICDLMGTLIYMKTALALLAWGG
jgi:magnesium transporter